MKTIIRYDIYDDGKRVKKSISAKEVAEYFDETNLGWASRYAKGGYLYKGRYRITSKEIEVERKHEIFVPPDLKREWDSVRFLLNPKARRDVRLYENS